jgi:LysR family transcriptional regulator (chromosome initiation inhibitor)
MLDYAHIAAMAAVIRTGSFEKAAHQLYVTPSAVSQRVKALEESLGRMLIVRGLPCVGTEAGNRLCRHAENVGLLEHILRTDLGRLMPEAPLATLRIAVNADSLATWFIDAMARTEGLLFDLVLDDEDHSADWLRRGEVSAAVSSNPASIQGCGSQALGSLRFLATASPKFMGRCFGDGVNTEAFRKAPSLRFNAKDELQVRWVEGIVGKRIAIPCHWIPSSQAFVDGTLAGVGWGMNPKPLVHDHLARGRLVEIVPGRPLDVPLYWQWSKAIERALTPMTAAVAAAAKQWLVR